LKMCQDASTAGALPWTRLGSLQRSPYSVAGCGEGKQVGKKEKGNGEAAEGKVKPPRAGILATALNERCRGRKSTPCLCGSLAQCALSLKRLSAEPGFNPQTRQNKLFQDYRSSCFEVNFSDRQEGLTVSSIICDRYSGYGVVMLVKCARLSKLSFKLSFASAL